MHLSPQDRPVAAARGTAFTLMEVMVCVGVAGLLFTSLYVGMSQGFRIIQAARENLRATQILQEKMETIRLYTWDQINSNGFIPATFSAPFYSNTNYVSDLIYNGTVSFGSVPGSEPYKVDMKSVSFTLNWYSGGVNHQREMHTFISRHGLQNYIY
jgi:type II secretory pathway pseudopilin PulG